MTTHATATFTVDGWDERPGAAAEIASATVRKTFAGDLEATSTAELLVCRNEGGQAYLVQERVEGRLGGRAGTFVLHHGGSSGEDGATIAFARVVPGSGTGELHGLRGEGAFTHDESGATFTLDYDLP